MKIWQKQSQKLWKVLPSTSQNLPWSNPDENEFTPNLKELMKNHLIQSNNQVALLQY
jgi:hypothetical protein